MNLYVRSADDTGAGDNYLLNIYQAFERQARILDLGAPARCGLIETILSMAL